MKDNKEKIKKLRKYYWDNCSHASREEWSNEENDLKNDISSIFGKFDVTEENISDDEIDNLKNLIDNCAIEVKKSKINSYLKYLDEKIIWRCESPYNIIEKEKIQTKFDYFYNLDYDKIEESELDDFYDLIQNFMWSKNEKN
jgi:hypothetical protein